MYYYYYSFYILDMGGRPEGALTCKCNLRVEPSSKTPFCRLYGSSSDPQLHIAPVLKTPVLSNSWFFTKKLAIFFEFHVCSKSPFFSWNFNSLPQKCLKNYSSLTPIFANKSVLFFRPRFGASRWTPPPKSKSSALPPPTGLHHFLL